MNLGQAVAVCLYELARDAKSSSALEKPALATAGDLERLTTLLLDALQASDYLKPEPSRINQRRTAAPAEEKIRRLIRRLNPSAEDAQLLLGMLRQIQRELDAAKQRVKKER